MSVYENDGVISYSETKSAEGNFRVLGCSRKPVVRYCRNSWSPSNLHKLIHQVSGRSRVQDLMAHSGEMGNGLVHHHHMREHAW